MNSNIFNSIILSNEQVNYLMGGTAGINRLSCLYQLIQIVTRQIETSNEVGKSTTELWEVNMSEVALSKLWKYVNPHYVPINQRDCSGKSNTMTSTTAFPNKEDPPIKNGGTSPTQLANSSSSSLTSGNGDNGEEEDVPPPSVSDMELEAEARRQFVKEQMEAEDAPQLLLLG